MASTVWADVLARIETKVNKYSYYTWFKQTTLARDDGRTLTFSSGGKTIVRYNYAHVEPPSGVDPVFGRSGYGSNSSAQPPTGSRSTRPRTSAGSAPASTSAPRAMSPAMPEKQWNQAIRLT